MKFLNLMYTNADIVNLLNYGIENEDYVVLEDGSLDYPEGTDSGNARYNINETWLFGNQYISKCWTGLMPGVRELSKEINDNAELSPLVGLTIDTSELSTELSSLTSAFNEFNRSLNCGVMNVETALPEFQSKLEAGGIDRLIESVQAQLDEWKNNQ